MVSIFEHKEAIASVAMDKYSDLVTISEGLTNNPKLYGIKVKIVCKKTGKVVWKGSMATACRALIEPTRFLSMELQ